MRKVYLQNGQKEARRFWKQNWDSSSLEQLVKLCDTDYMKPIFLSFLPKQGKILDAGCGLGQNVIYCRKLGFDMEGIDFVENLISRAIEYDPRLPVKIGDLRNIPYPDSYFKAYFAAGVIEHFENGAQEVLKEAARVLSGDGLLIVSVPYLNLKRRIEDFFFFSFLKRRYRHKSLDNGTLLRYSVFASNTAQTDFYDTGYTFYEYEYTAGEIRRILEVAGFKIIRISGACVLGGLLEFAFLRRINKKIEESKKIKIEKSRIGLMYDNPPVGILKNFFKEILVYENPRSVIGKILLCILRNCFAHMQVIICRKG